MKRFALIGIILMLFLAPISVDVGSAGVVLEPAYAHAAANECSWYDITCGLKTFLSWLAFIPIFITGLLVYFTGFLLNIAVLETIVNFGVLFRSIDGIATAWSAFRDIANIFFIFSLLAIAIATILGVSNYGYKKLLAQLIIVALVINFSLFATKFVIDTSNLFALQFYKPLAGESSDGGFSGPANVFMRHFGLTTAFDTDPLLDKLKGIAVGTGGNDTGDIGLMFAYAFFVSIFFLITAFIFGAAAILLIVRAVMFILLAILSPLAFAALILPNTSQYMSTWWKKLWEYAIFAPVLMILFWVTATVIPDVAGSLGNTGSIADAFSPDITRSSQGMMLMFNFFIVSGLLIASLMVAKNLSIAGASSMSSFGQGMASAAGKWTSRKAGGATLGTVGGIMRGTVGRGADKFANSKWAQRFELRNPRLGGMLTRGAQGVSKAQLDPRSLLGKDAQGFVGTPGTGGYVEGVRRVAEQRLQGADRVAKLGGKDARKQALYRYLYGRQLRAGKYLKATGGYGTVSPTAYDANKKASGSITAVAQGTLAEQDIKEANKKLNEINRDLGKARAALNAAPAAGKAAAKLDIDDLEDKKAVWEETKTKAQGRKEAADKAKDAYKEKK